MLVSEAIANLAKTELKMLKVATDSAAVMGYINEAVLELHKRFNLWEAEATITQPDTTTLSYTLDGVDANVDIDLSDKILLVINKIWDPDGTELELNDEDDETSPATPRYNVIEFQEAIALDAYSVTYRASPLDRALVTETIELPPSLFEAMYFYVGFRAHVSQRGSKEFENDTHFKRYDQACDRVQKLGLIVADSYHSHKFYDSCFP